MIISFFLSLIFLIGLLILLFLIIHLIKQYRK
ncbi:Uncharacterised protein [Streptococcus massiliensis]|uniref:Uncharacterized protein n=1 Tax=Streptococcus massiliensis TaxID=313439 RepID=A0A380L0U7_9STRE|nr:Uncharacterised protein [Streptococcus massiliensis]